MKRRFLILIATAAFVSALSTNALGQTDIAVKASVKFDFHIGERLYPAGEYRIESIGSMSGTILQIRSVGDTNHRQIIMANHSNPGKRQTPVLVFQKYGENYFLHEIVLGTDWGYSIHPSRRQRQSEKDLALVSLEKN
jgi:hypothetical protein